MANFKLNQTGEQIQADLNLLDSNSATEGQVLTANGTGGASWQNASGGGGTEVVANPVLAGTETDLTGLEVAGTKYKIPTGGSGGGTQWYLHKITSEVYSNGLYFISNKSEAMVIEQGKDYVYCSNFSPTDTIPIINLFNIYNGDSFPNYAPTVIKINVGSPRGNIGYFITSEITEDPTLNNTLTRVDFDLTMVDTVTPL